MTREQRDALKRELLRQHPNLAEELTDVIRHRSGFLELH
jgi:hypothetical protein